MGSWEVPGKLNKAGFIRWAVIAFVAHEDNLHCGRIVEIERFGQTAVG